MVVLLALALAAAACDDDTSDATSTSPPATDPPTTTAAPTITGPTTTTAPTTTAAATTTTAPTPPAPLVGGTLTIESLVIAAGDPAAHSPFTTSGSADICPEGEFGTLEGVITNDIQTYSDRYTCADGSGSFILSAELVLDPEVQNPATLEGTWIIGGGTGAYKELEGSGTVKAKFAPLHKETYTGEVSYGPSAEG